MLSFINNLFVSKSEKTSTPKENVIHTLGFLEIQDEIAVLLTDIKYCSMESLLSYHKSFLSSNDEYKKQYTQTLECSFIDSFVKDPHSERTSNLETEIRKVYKIVQKP